MAMAANGRIQEGLSYDFSDVFLLCSGKCFFFQCHRILVNHIAAPGELIPGYAIVATTKNENASNL